MFINRRGAGIALAATAALVLSVGCSSDGPGPLDGSGGGGDGGTIRFGHTLTQDSSWQVAAEYFKEQIEEKTDGRYTVEIFADGQISSGNQRVALDMLRAGNYEVDITSTLIWSSLDDRFGILALPWIVPSIEEVEAVIDGEAGEMVLEILGEQGVTPVAIGETGFRQMLNNERQIEAPEDLAGLQMRVPGTPLYQEVFGELGADPVEMDFTEVFTALQQGTIDGMEGVPDVMVTNRFFEVLDYMSVTNYNFDFFFMTYNEEFFEGLSEEDQEIFMQAGQEASAHASEYARDSEAEALETLRSEIEVYEPTEEQIQAFKDAVLPIYEDYRDSYDEELREAFNYPN